MFEALSHLFEPKHRPDDKTVVAKFGDNELKTLGDHYIILF